MKRIIFSLFTLLVTVSFCWCQTIKQLDEQIEYEYYFNDPSDVARLLLVAETGIDGSIGAAGFLFDINLGLTSRYSLSNNIDLQMKLRKSVLSFHFDPEYRKNFEMEATGTYFIDDKVKPKNERVIVSSVERGNMIQTKFFNTDLPQRNAFGFGGGLNLKTLGIDPTESAYNGSRKNVNFSTVSLIAGIQFKRINASSINVKKPRANPIFDNYVVMSIDGIVAPVNTFSDALTGEAVGAELKDGGLVSVPFGARFTYSVFGSIPTYNHAKSFRYTVATAIGYRPYLGFHFDFTVGFMLLRRR